MIVSRACPGCGNPKWYPCPDCVASVPSAPAVEVPGARSAFGVAHYSGVVHQFIAEVKQPGGRTFIDWWADAVAACADDDLDTITWIPASRSGRRERGRDQSALLARSVGRRLGRPAMPCLRRLDERHQTGLSRASRLDVRFVCTRDLEGRAVLVVDDVHTTGASAAAGVAELLGYGARAVDVMVLAVVERSGAQRASHRLQ